ncbi:hypothetical protein ACFYOF_20460 [Streptomyces sp. NPDC007148]|uniref:hypothetical protein n=1 Tax=Streptomyces sp. NPDC007148 TaxID=3364775 RepID=UPI003673787F
MAQQTTDRGPGATQGITSEHESQAARVLAEIAGVLATEQPGIILDGIDFAVLVGAKAYELGGRSCHGRGPSISRLVLNRMGDVPAGVTPVEFAVRVAQAAAALGYDWAADDNRPVVPRFPAPRKPEASQPEAVR